MKAYSITSSIKFMLCFFIGMLCCHLFYRFTASIFLPSTPWKKAIPVKVGNLLREEQWIQNYSLSAAYLDEISGRREYILLILEPKTKTPLPEITEQAGSFTISGLADSKLKIAFQISSSDLKNGNGSQILLIINVPSPFFGPKSAFLTDSLRLDHDE